MASFGVGRVRSLFMYPMSFDEFLVATGHVGWIEAKQNASPAEPLFEALHGKLVESFRNYLMVGGMPESVHNWVETGDYLKCQQVQDDIMLAYEDDFSKYEEKADPMLLRQTLHSVAQQIGGKFVYSNVQGNYRSEKIKGALELLKYNTPVQRHDLYYWQNLSRGAQAEVDYVLVKDMQVVPLAVKAGTTGSMKSMYQFMEEKHLTYGIRTSLENFGKLKKVDIVPLYALSNLYK